MWAVHVRRISYIARWRLSRTLCNDARRSGFGLRLLSADFCVYGFTELRQARPLVLALPLMGDALAERGRFRRSIQWLVVVVGMVVVVGRFRSRCRVGLDRLTDLGVCFLPPPADAGGDRFLGGGLLPLDTL